MPGREDETPEAEPEERKAWVTPEVNEIRAGSAELGDLTNPDGSINS